MGSGAPRSEDWLAREALSGVEESGDAGAASAAPAAAAPNARGTTAYTPTVPRGARAEADDDDGDVNVEEEEEEIGSTAIQINDDVALLPPSTSKDEYWLARVVGVDSDSSLRVQYYELDSDVPQQYYLDEGQLHTISTSAVLSTVIVVALPTGRFTVSDDTVSMLTALARASKTQLNAARLANRALVTDARARLRALRADEGYTVRQTSRSRRCRPA